MVNTTNKNSLSKSKAKKKKLIISSVDLFCGVGGLTHGLKKSGITVRAGIDLDTSCKFAYETNNKAEFLGKDISQLTGKHLKKYWKKGEVKVLVGCAPCQPFSTHSNKISDEEKEIGDKWNLLNEFVRIIRETKPVVVSMENVPNLSNKEIFKKFVATLQELKYKVSYKNVYCPDFGIPQKRRRLVLLASRLGKIELIPPTHTKKNYPTVREAIGHLEIIDNGERSEIDKLHFTTELSDINLQRIRASVPNGTWEDWDIDLRLECHKKDSGNTYKSVYGRMSWDDPSPTITTQFYNYGTGRFGHPLQDRAITVREASILQSFPSNYKFVDTKDEVSIKRLGTHIGNAVPVNLGWAIGKSIIKHVNDVKNG